MVREKGDPLSLETFRRLGANVVRCPNCELLFNAIQKPSHSIIMFVDGEIVDSDDPSWFCSAECAKSVADERNMTAPNNTNHLDWTDE